MKTLISIFLMFPWSGTLLLPAAVVTGNVQDTGLAPASLTITFTPLSTPLARPPAIIQSSLRTVETDANGDFSLTLAPGDYRVTLGANPRDSILLAVPEGAGPYGWTALLTSTLAYRYPWSPQYLDQALAQSKGDLYVFNGTNATRLPPGAAGHWLAADANTATGLRWNDAAPLTNGLAGISYVDAVVRTNASEIWLLPTDALLAGGTVVVSEFQGVPLLSVSSNSSGKTIFWNLRPGALAGTNFTFSLWFLTTNATALNPRGCLTVLSNNGVGGFYLKAEAERLDVPGSGTNITAWHWTSALATTNLAALSVKYNDLYHYNTNGFYYIVKGRLVFW